MSKFLRENLKYSPKAVREKQQEKGLRLLLLMWMAHYPVLKLSGVSPEIDAETLRVISIMPKWILSEEKSKM